MHILRMAHAIEVHAWDSSHVGSLYIEPLPLNRRAGAFSTALPRPATFFMATTGMGDTTLPQCTFPTVLAHQWGQVGLLGQPLQELSWQL